MGESCKGRQPDVFADGILFDGVLNDTHVLYHDSSKLASELRYVGHLFYLSGGLLAYAKTRQAHRIVVLVLLKSISSFLILLTKFLLAGSCSPLDAPCYVVLIKANCPLFQSTMLYQLPSPASPRQPILSPWLSGSHSDSPAP